MEREITLRDYGRVIWSGRWLILGAALLAGLIGLLVTFISTTTYTATARVYLGQATTVSGVPVSTPATNPATAATVLGNDALVAAVGEAAGVDPDRVRDGVAFTVPRTPGSQAGNQPTIAAITFTDEDRGITERVVNAYAEEVNRTAGRLFQQGQDVYRRRISLAQAELGRVENRIERFSDILAGATSDQEVLGYQSLLFAAQSQQLQVRSDLNNAELALLKAQQIEAPYIIELADSVASSTAAPRRVRSIVLAMIIGLIIGIVVTFVWKGSPAGRAARTG